LLVHPVFGRSEQCRAVVDDESPAHDLCADVEALGDHALDVFLIAEQAAERPSDIQSVRLVLRVRHLDDGDQDEEHEDHQADAHVGRADNP